MIDWIWRLHQLTKHAVAVEIDHDTLPETNSSHLKMDGWITSFLLGWHLFRCYVIFRVDHQSVSSCCPSIMLYQLFINQLFILFHVFLALEVGEAFRRSVYDPAWRRLRLGPIKISAPSTMRGFVESNESNECLYDHMPSLHFQSVFNVPWSAHWNCGTILNQQGLSGSFWKPPKKWHKD